MCFFAIQEIEIDLTTQEQNIDVFTHIDYKMLTTEQEVLYISKIIENNLLKVTHKIDSALESGAVFYKIRKSTDKEQTVILLPQFPSNQEKYRSAHFDMRLVSNLIVDPQCANMTSEELQSIDSLTFLSRLKRGIRLLTS